MRNFALGLAVAALCTAGAANAQTANPIRFGVLNDQAGPYSDQTGKGSVLAARMAIEDFGTTVLGRPIEVLVGDHQNKPDVGSSIVQQWFEREGVEMVVDVPTSSVALAVQKLGRDAKKIVLFSGSAAPELTGTACAPLSAQWTYSTYAVAAGTAAAATKNGGDTWFVLAVDYSFGAAMTKDLTTAVTANGGKVLASVKHPLGAQDFASQLLTAQSSGAKVIGLVNAGRDFSSAVKQAAEFGITAGGQKIAGMIVTAVDIKALGLNVAQGLIFTESFYWDLDDETRAWSKRFFDKQGAMPTMVQAGVYSATLHWLRAIKAVGTVDSETVARQMRATPVDDMMTKGARIRADGQLMRDFYLFEAKKPSESKGPWDLYKLVRKIPAEEAARPLAEGGCPLVK